MMNNGYGWGMGWGFPFMGIFFLIFFIMGIIYLIKIISGKDEKEMSLEQPLDILKQRYARGEIDQQTFDEMKRRLT